MKIANFYNASDIVLFYPNFLTSSDSKYFFSHLFKEIFWRKEKVKLFGKTTPVPRLSAWHGDFPYTFSGLKMTPNPLTPKLLYLKELAQKKTGVKFNSVLLNLYRDGNDSISWHSDNEAELGEKPVIASLSLGFERIFRFRNKTDKTKKVSFKLASGSLLYMAGDTQKNWEHSVPKTSKKIGPRINLTFRKVFDQKISKG